MNTDNATQSERPTDLIGGGSVPDPLEADDAESTEQIPKPSNHGDLLFLYAKDLERCRPLSFDEQQHYARLARQGDKKAFDIMVQSNLRLVVKLCRRHQHRGLPLLDLIEEGNLGLIHAVEKFEPERGFRFSSYAVWWIRESVESAILNQTRTVRLPIHIAKELKACMDTSRRLSASLDHDPTPREIAGAIGKPLDEIARLIELKEETVPLDVPVDADDDEDAEESAMVSEGQADLIEALTEEVLEQHLEEWVDTLTARQREIICRRYGLRGRAAETLKQIAMTLGVGPSRVREIQVAALKVLRSKAESQG